MTNNALKMMTIEEALESKEVQKVMHKASSRFTRQLDVDTLQSCHMVALWRAMEKFDFSRGTKFMTYLYKCVFVECLKEAKFINKGRKLEQRKLHDNIEATRNDPSLTLVDIMDEISNEEEAELLRDKLANKTIAEMAESRNVSRETVRRQLNTLKARLRRAFVR